MSRRTEIIEDAATRADGLLKANRGKSPTVQLRLIQINEICRTYVENVPPRNVSATAVCEELGSMIDKNTGEEPLSVSTIYNNGETYAAIVRIWKSAYNELKLIKAHKLRSPVVQLSEAAFQGMDIGTANTVRLVQAQLREHIKLVNEYQEFITEHVPISVFGDVGQPSDMLDMFEDWMEWIKSRGFIMDGEAIKVSSRTGIGTPIMTLELFKRIETAVGRFRGGQKLKSRQRP